MKKIMKKIIIIIFLGVFCFLGTPVFATIYSGEAIDYQVDLNIRPDAAIEVSEKIQYDFRGGVDKKLQRVIPLISDINGESVRIKITKLEVIDNTGKQVEFEVEKSKSEYLITISNSIGTVNTYTIKYTVKRALLDSDENKLMNINWLGRISSSDIKQTKLTVKLPAEVSSKDLQAKCLSGQGDMVNCISNRFEYKEGDKVNSLVFIDDKLDFTDEIKFDLSMPKSVITERDYAEIFLAVIGSYKLYLAVVVLLIVRLVYKKYKQ
jgi:hypothetical protein